jgi:hypothetical protein
MRPMRGWFECASMGVETIAYFQGGVSAFAAYYVVAQTIPTEYIAKVKAHALESSPLGVQSSLIIVPLYP